MKSVWAALFAACLFLTGAAAQTPLFQSPDLLEIALRGPYKTLARKKDDKVEYDFVLQTDGQTIPVAVRARGHSRLRICTQPPLRLNFAGEDAAETSFAGVDKMKLVLPCFDRTKAQEDVIQEYLAYRIFNLVTDESYRVRLLQITIENEDDGAVKPYAPRYAFAIEPPDVFAERAGATRVKAAGVTLSSLDAAHLARMFVFHYLIGNTDWSLVMADGDDACCHNGHLYDIGAARFLVPYDFDLAGLVDPPYGFPDPSLPIKRVTQRYYRGFCMDDGPLREALAAFRLQRSEINALIADTPGLSDKESRKSQKFIDAFYAEAADEEKLLKAFERRCL